LSVNDVTVVEGTGAPMSAVFTVTLSAASAQPVTVGYDTASGTATAPADFAATAGTLTFAPGATSQTVSVSIVARKARASRPGPRRSGWDRGRRRWPP
jgi:hypothetical protein